MTSQSDLPQPPNPLGHDPTQRAAPPIVMLAVPKSWTRLVVAIVALLFLVTCVVTFMVYLNYMSAKANTDRIDDLYRKVGHLEEAARQGK